MHIPVLHDDGLSPAALWCISRHQNRCDYPMCWPCTRSHAYLLYSLPARRLIVPACTFALCISKEKDILRKVQRTVQILNRALSAYTAVTAAEMQDHMEACQNTHACTHIRAHRSPEAGLHRKRDLFPLIQVCRYSLLIKQPFSPVSSPLPPSHPLQNKHIDWHFKEEQKKSARL